MTLAPPILWPLHCRIDAFASHLDSYFPPAGEYSFLTAFAHVPDIPVREAYLTLYGRDMVSGAAGATAPNPDSDGYVQFEIVQPPEPGSGDENVLVIAGTDRLGEFTKFQRVLFQFRSGFARFGEPCYVRVTFYKHDVTRTSIWRAIDEVEVTMLLEVPRVIEPYFAEDTRNFESATTR